MQTLDGTTPPDERMRCRYIPPLLVALLILSVPAAALAMPPQDPAVSEAAQSAASLSPQDLDRKTAIGYAQLEIIRDLIRQGKFEKVLAETKVLLNLDLPEPYELYVVESAVIIAELLAEQRQWDLSHKILDEAFLRMKSNDSKGKVLIGKARIYQQEGQRDKATATYRLALTYLNMVVKPAAENPIKK